MSLTAASVGTVHNYNKNDQNIGYISEGRVKEPVPVGSCGLVEAGSQSSSVVSTIYFETVSKPPDLGRLARDLSSCLHLPSVRMTGVHTAMAALSLRAGY